MEILERDANIDNLVLMTAPKPGRRITPQHFESDITLMNDIKKRTSKPLLSIVYCHTPDAVKEARDIILKFQERGIAAFPSIGRAASALRNTLDYYSFKSSTDS